MYWRVLWIFGSYPHMTCGMSVMGPNPEYGACCLHTDSEGFTVSWFHAQTCVLVSWPKIDEPSYWWTSNFLIPWMPCQNKGNLRFLDFKRQRRGILLSFLHPLIQIFIEAWEVQSRAAQVILNSCLQYIQRNSKKRERTYLNQQSEKEDMENLHLTEWQTLSSEMQDFSDIK